MSMGTSAEMLMNMKMDDAANETMDQEIKSCHRYEVGGPLKTIRYQL